MRIMSESHSKMEREGSFTLRELLVVTVTLLTGFSVYFQFGYNSAAISAIGAEGILTLDQTALFSSISRLGMVAGGLFTAANMDRLGRKGMLLLSCVFGVVGWAMVAGGDMAAVLLTGKVAIGISAGMGVCSGRAYVTETSRSSVRGASTSIGTLIEVVGYFLVSVAGLFLNWRYLALIPAVVMTLQAFALQTFPKSPRWLLLQGRKEEAKLSLQWLRGNEENNAEYDNITEQMNSSTFTLAHLKHPCYYKPATLSILLEISSYVSTNSVLLTYLSIVFIRVGWGDRLVLTTATAASLELVAWAVAYNLLDIIGRRPLLLTGLVLRVLSSSLLGLAFYLTENTQTKVPTGVSWMALAVILIYLFSHTSFVEPSVATARTEILPNEIRGQVMGVSAVVQALLVLGLLESFPYADRDKFGHVAFWTLSGVELIYLALVAVYLPETKKKSLEDIRELFTGTDFQRM